MTGGVAGFGGSWFASNVGQFNQNMTAGVTFFGQFLDHDLTFDLGSRLGVPAVPALSRKIGDSLPPPFHAAPHEVAALAIDAESVRAAWRAGAGLVAGLGSGSSGAALRDAGAEVLIEAPSELGSGSLLHAFADKFADLPPAAPALIARRSAALALMFDFDGTLAPQPEHPADGRLPSAVRGTCASAGDPRATTRAMRADPKVRMISPPMVRAPHRMTPSAPRNLLFIRPYGSLPLRE